MSMPALLSHFGISQSRYVTASGEVIFDGVAKTDGGFTHATYGAVTQIMPHTFHGGDALLDGASADLVWWDDPHEIASHVHGMQTAFPGFLYTPADDGLPPSWTGEINTGRGRFMVGIIMRADKGLPHVGVQGGIRLGVSAGRWWIPAPHLYSSGALCVADQDDWDPSRHTAVTVTAWAAHWLAAYTEWRFTRRWPAEGAQLHAS